MADGHLTYDEFLSRLAALLESRRTSHHGSVYLTQKRLTPQELPTKTTNTLVPPSSPFPDLHLEHPLPILIRATNGKSQEKKRDKVKFSTIVQPVELESFYVKYAEVCKAGMSGMKKRDRSGRKAKEKKKKQKEKQAEKKG